MSYDNKIPLPQDRPPSEITLQKEIQRVLDANEELNSENGQLREEKEKLKAENEKLLFDIDCKKCAIKSLYDTCEQLKAQLQQLKQANSGLASAAIAKSECKHEHTAISNGCKVCVNCHKWLSQQEELHKLKSINIR